MNYSYWLSKAGGCGDGPRNDGDTNSRDSLRITTDDLSASSFTARPHMMMTSLSPLANSPSSAFAPGQFHHLGGHPSSLRTMMCPLAGAEYPHNQSYVGHTSELQASSELRFLNHTACIPSTPRFSSSTRFVGIDTYTINKEVENMRQVLGKGTNRSSSKFTLMGEPVEKGAETPSSVGFDYDNLHREMSALAPHFGTPSANCYISFGSIGNSGNPTIYATSSRAGSKSSPIRRKYTNNENIFPANVKSLLSTRIFDGVPVKYVSWDRTKSVRGTIHGAGYLCWCKKCGKKKLVSAYQLEEHAGAKSKHPNNNIYFSNGKSIHGVVQELKNTSSDKLLEVIPIVTGCWINEANFSKWKGSFQPVQRELERIFGSDPEEHS